MQINEYIATQKTSRQIYGLLAQGALSRSTPSFPSEIENRIRDALLDHAPLSFLGLWGGSKDGILGDDADVKSLNFIAATQTKVREYEASAQFYILFCDMHHVLVNGKSLAEANAYYSALIPKAQERGLECIRLQDLLGAGEIESYSDEISRRKAGMIVGHQEVLKVLVQAAKKHSLFVGDEITPEEIARTYVDVEVFFLERIAAQCPHNIFFSFSNPLIQRPIAEAAHIPMLYFHSSGKGHHDCPWYNKEEKPYQR